MRDYAAEMMTWVDRAINEAPYVSRAIAARVIADLKENDPELLSGWLQAQAEGFLWQAINDRDRSVRAHAKATSRPRAFSDDASSGEPARLAQWLNVPFVVEDGTRKKLGDMVGTDLKFAADSYQRRADDNMLTSAFLRAIGKRIGDQHVSDVYTDQELSTMWTSLRGN